MQSVLALIIVHMPDGTMDMYLQAIFGLPSQRQPTEQPPIGTPGGAAACNAGDEFRPRTVQLPPVISQ